MEIKASQVQVRYITIKYKIKDKLNRLCYMLNITSCYIPCIISCTLNLMDEYILKHYESIEEDIEKCNFRLSIITFACLWISTKFHDDNILYGVDIEYVTHIKWNIIAKEEMKILDAIKYDIYKFMIEEEAVLSKLYL